MANSCVFILLMVYLSCNFLHSNSIVGENHSFNGNKEYATKPKGTIKTMKWQHGDLVDCVDIYKQPSMNHPLLKNHIIQLEPPSSPPNSLIHNVSHSSPLNVPNKWRCPHGSIPIRRPFKDELVRATFPPSRHANRSKVNDPPGTMHKYAVVEQALDGLTSVSGLINVWKPTTEQTDFSLAQLWVTHSIGFLVNEAVEAGWTVYPNKFGDHEPRLFIYFTNDGYRTGCYNLDCPGFVHVAREVCLGCKLSPYSTYNGDQFYIEIGLKQHAETKDRWVRWAERSFGYYPHDLFPRLSQDGATDVSWGGEITQAPQVITPTTTQMGSGHFPEEGLKRAAYFKNMQYEDASFRLHNPKDGGVLKVITHPECYRLTRIIDSDFFYGGPGGGASGCT